MLTFIIDTSAITDPRLRERLKTKTLEETLEKILELMALCKVRLGMHFYTTPGLLKEMIGFLERSGASAEVVAKLEAWVMPRTPSGELQLPAVLIVEMVRSMRRRFDKGLRVAEGMVKEAHKGERDLPSLIRELREKYREATRKGIIDSEPDVEAVLLAYQLNAILVTNDEGVCEFAKKLGVTCIDPLTFVKTLEEYLKLSKPA